VSQIAGHCPDRAVEQPFVQLHEDPGSCADVPDGICPEWSPAACGAALFLGLLPAQGSFPGIPKLSGRVA